jgi:hypothetical protein
MVLALLPTLRAGLIAATTVVWLTLVGNAGRAQSPDAAFLAGLRERRLFELAERHCVARLANPEVVDPLRTELVVEQLRTHATRAIHAPAAEREAVWRQARRVAAEFIRASPSPPRIVLVQLQDALTPLAAGELGRQEFQAGALAALHLEPTKQTLREAAELLETLDKELSAAIPLRRRTPPRPPELTADELVSLQQQTRRQLAGAYRNRALLYATESDDRLALVLRAVETLQATLSQLAGDDPLSPALRLDLAECQRLLGRRDEAGQLLVGLDTDGIDPQVRLAARAELIRLAIEQDNTAMAERLLEQGRSLDGHVAAELDFAWFEAFLTLARQAKEPVAAKRYQDQVAESAKTLEATHGPYWGRRADQLLAATLPRLGSHVELLARGADQLFLQREFDRAIAAYDDAAAQARAGGDLQASFELGYKSALVEQNRQAHAEAARRFRALGKGLATHPQAPVAHLAAAWHAAQLAKDSAAAAETYSEILREHLASWPSHASSAQARLWLGRWHESRREWADAAAAYAQVPHASEHFPAAVAGLATASRQQLAALESAGESAAEPAAAAIDRLHKALVADKGELPVTWTSSDRAAALAAAEIMLRYRTGEAPAAEKLLAAALADAADAPAEWRAAATAQLVIAQANQPERRDLARQTLQKLSESPEQLSAVIDGLARVREQSPAQQREAIANLQLVAIESLAPRRAELTADLRRSLDRAEASALAAAGQRDRALAAYRKLAAANPDDGGVQQGYAELLLAGDDRDSLQAALTQWRVIASRSRPRSERWLRAKHSVALAQYKLGDNAGAAALLAYVLETPPGLAGSAWEGQYRELLAKCIP